MLNKKNNIRTVLLSVISASIFFLTCSGNVLDSASDSENYPVGNSWDQADISSRRLSDGNINANPDWDWEKENLQGVERQEILYYLGGYDYPEPHNRYLPFHGLDGGPATTAFNIHHDMEKDKGWVLLAKNFGDPDYEAEIPKYPFFILYNRMRGLIRIFYYYNENLQTYSFGEVTLSHPVNEGKSAYLTWNRSENACLDDYLKNTTTLDNGMTVTSANRLSPGWNWADFTVSYSPEIETDSVLLFNFEGIEKADLKFDGNLRLDQYTEIVGSVNISPKDRLFSSLSEFGLHAKNIFVAIHETQKQKAQEEGEEPNIDYTCNYTYCLTKGNTKGWGTVAMAAFQMSKFLYSLATAPTSQDVVQMGYKGTINLTGESITPRDIGGDIKIKAPGAIHTTLSENAYDVYYGKPLGVFTLETRPKMGYTNKGALVGATNSSIYSEYIGLLEPLRIKINPAIYEEFNGYKYKVTSIKASYVWNGIYMKMRPWRKEEITILGNGYLVDRQNIDILPTHDENNNSFVDPDRFFDENNFFKITKTYRGDGIYMRRLQLELLSGSCSGEVWDKPDCIDGVHSWEHRPYIMVRVTVEPDPPIAGYEPVVVAKKFKPEWIRDPKNPNENKYLLLPANWNPGNKILFEHSNHYVQMSNGDGVYADFIDMNGDGLPDRIMHYNYDLKKSGPWVALNTGSGFLAPERWNTDDNMLGEHSNHYVRMSNGDGVYADLIDMNGDELPDRVMHYNYKTKQYGPWVALNTGHGFAAPENWNPGNMLYEHTSHYIRAKDSAGVFADFIDMNGDGLPDRVTHYNYKTKQYGPWVALNTGNGFLSPERWNTDDNMLGENGNHRIRMSNGDGVYADLIDMNGDKMPDRVMHYNYEAEEYGPWVALNTGYGFQAPVNWNPGNKILFEHSSHYIRMSNSDGVYGDFIDMNGDGLPDRVMHYNYALEISGPWVALNTGSGFLAPERWNTADNMLGEHSNHYVRMSNGGGVYGDFIDMNGDKLPDRVMHYNYNTLQYGPWVAFNTGSGFLEPERWNTDDNILGENNNHYVQMSNGDGVYADFIDMNGDGLPDRVMHYNYKAEEPGPWVAISHYNK